MAREINFIDGLTVVPGEWLNAMQEVLNELALGVKVEAQSTTAVRVPASASDIASLVIDGELRYISSNISVTISGGAGTYNIYATADTPDRLFALEAVIGASGATKSRKIAEVDWDGAQIDGDIRNHADIIHGNDLDALSLVSESRVEDLENNAILKTARVASLTNIDVSSPGASIGGESLNIDDRVALLSQTSGSEEGIWSFNGAASPMTRVNDWDSGQVIPEGMMVYIQEGTYAQSIWAPNSDVTVGTTNPSWLNPVITSGIAQTISGLKTFGSIPVLPASNPTTDNQAVRKAFVDQEIANAAAAPGSLLLYAGFGTLTGYLSCDGTAVDRTDESDLKDAITITQSGNKTSGSASITGLPDTSEMKAGYDVEGSGIPANTSILSVDSSSAITLDQNATSTETSDIVVFPHGNGNGTTTFNVPNYNDRMLVGESSTKKVGMTGGASTATLAVANLPPHEHALGQVHRSSVGISPASSGAILVTEASGEGVDYIPDSETVGSGTAFSIMNPYAVAKIMIKT